MHCVYIYIYIYLLEEFVYEIRSFYVETYLYFVRCVQEVLNFAYSRPQRPGKINFGFNYRKRNTVLNVAIDNQMCSGVGCIDSEILLRRNGRNDQRRRVNSANPRRRGFYYSQSVVILTQFYIMYRS